MLSSCGKHSDVVLYEKGDPEYARLASLAMRECIDDAKIFKELDKTNDFSKFKVGTIYRSIDEVKDESRVTRYFKILSITGSKMQIGLKSSNASENMVFDFYQEDGKEILGTFQNGICSKPRKKYDDHSKLSSTSILTVSKTRKNEWREGGKDIYKKINEVMKVEKKYPLIFLNWNGNVTHESNEIGKVVKKQHELSFKDISTSECDRENLCDFVDIHSYKTCSVVVDDKAYDRTKVEEKFIDFSNCTSI